jgi:hypothetical protein
MRRLVAVAICQVQNAISCGIILVRSVSDPFRHPIKDVGTPIRHIPGQPAARHSSRSFPFPGSDHTSLENCNIGHARKRACQPYWSITCPPKYYLSYTNRHFPPVDRQELTRANLRCLASLAIDMSRKKKVQARVRRLASFCLRQRLALHASSTSCAHIVSAGSLPIGLPGEYNLS